MKNPKINYTSRNFQDIKTDLTNHLKKYYPNVSTDFSEASVTSMLLDTVAYVGDIMSFQLDFQTNESFLTTAITRDNLLKIAKQIGFINSPTNVLVGTVSFFVLIPANNLGTEPDYTYAPTIKKGTQIKSTISGINLRLIDDVVINETVVSNYVPAIFSNDSGRVTYYAVKVYGNVQSLQITTQNITVSNFTPFNKIPLQLSNVVEVISVFDSDGNQYYQVPSLTQNIVYKSVSNTNTDINEPKYLLRPFHAARRFMVEKDDTVSYLVFGGKNVNNTIDLRADELAEPSKVAIKRYKSDYISETFLEPNKLIDNDEFGIGPDNTVLTIVYSTNNTLLPSIQAGAVNSVSNLSIIFNPTATDNTIKNKIIQSIEVTNEEPILGGSSGNTIEELRQKIASTHQMQNRAVTERDYEAACYLMPENFGKIKRVRVARDKNSLKNNLNIYVIGEGNSFTLLKLNTTIKQNLKTWLNQYRILTDTVDILDAKIINLGIKYEILVDPNYVTEEVLLNATNQLKSFFSMNLEIGQPFIITDVLRELRKVSGILDITKLEFENKTGLDYSSIVYNIKENTTSDGRMIKIPENCIFEIKNFDTDVIGVAK